MHMEYWGLLILYPRGVCVTGASLVTFLPCRSDPVAFDARLEKRKEVRKQPLGSSAQSEYVRSVEEKVT